MTLETMLQQQEKPGFFKKTWTSMKKKAGLTIAGATLLTGGLLARVS